MSEHSQKPITVYYDGTCALCTTAVNAFGAEHIEQKDLTREALPADISFAQAWNEMYVVDAAGTKYRGADAVLRILDEHRGWRWLARIGRLPVLHSIAMFLYSFIARHRHQLFGVRKG